MKTINTTTNPPPNINGKNSLSRRPENILEDSYDKDPEKFKQNVLAIHDTVKNDIGSSIKSSSKIFSGLLDKLFLPLILGGSLVVVLIVFKK